jgi:cytoskeletal protein RodZ
LDYVDFGRYLSQQRELRGVSLQEVSFLTRISSPMLVALENGQLERLPGRAFVVGFIRAYAHAVGLEVEDVVLRFQEIERASPTPVDAPERATTWLLEGGLASKALVPLVLAMAALAAFFLGSARLNVFHR